LYSGVVAVLAAAAHVAAGCERLRI
jgi:hypothetical protein